MRNIMYQNSKLIFMLLLSVLFSSCTKEFLNVKRDKTQVVPERLTDFRAILDDDGSINYNFPNQLAIVGADEYYVEQGIWSSLANPSDRNGYIWANDIYEGSTGDDWNRGYEKILYANFVLDGIRDIKPTVQEQLLYNEIKGGALFLRAFNYFLLAQLFCPQYDINNAHISLGLPLRNTSNINVKFSRSSLKDTYDFLITDILSAIDLLPIETLANTRPSKTAALSLLAMVYLQMGNYSESRKYAEIALGQKSSLIDYNDIQVSAAVPFSPYGRENIEILFYSQSVPSPIMLTSRLTIDSVLYNSYEDVDLRKQAYFTKNGNRTIFKGGYTGTSFFLFTGLSVGELYLIASESILMDKSNPDKDKSINLLNIFRMNRISKDDFSPILNYISKEECLNIIQEERNRELLLRGRRWQDLRRYIAEGRLNTGLVRVLEENSYSLELNSLKWTWPIPDDVLKISGISQNPR